MKNNNVFPWVATPLALAISGFAVGNASASATTDTSFGTNGIATLNFNNPGVLYSSGSMGTYPEPAPIISRQPIVELDNGDLVSFASRYEETGTVSLYCTFWSGGSCYGLRGSYGNLQEGTSKTRMSRFTAGGEYLSAVDVGGVMAVSALKQPDGKLVLMGNDLVRGAGSWSYRYFSCSYSGPPCEDTSVTVPKPTMTSQIVLKRFNIDGTADNTFDSDGTLRIGVPGARQAKEFALMPDGKIVLLSVDFNSSSTNPQLLRFNTDGSIDTSFGGGDGSFSLPISNAWGMLKQQDNKLLVRYNDSALQAYARFNIDGSLDNSFDGDGILNINEPFYSYAPMLQQADGKLLLAAHHVYRYSLNGTHEKKFNNPAEYSVHPRSLAETSAGEVLVVRNTQHEKGKIDVFNSNGSFYATVNLDVILYNYWADNDQFGEILLQSGGDLLVSGRVSDAGSAVLTRHINFTPGDNDLDGIPDPIDNCAMIDNANQDDSDKDGAGDVCDASPFVANAASLNVGFEPGSGSSDSVYTSAVQADGKIVIGGAFTSFNGAAKNHIARLNADGSLDAGFNDVILGTSSNGTTIYTSVVQPDGKIIIGGIFAGVNGIPRNNIARLNADGSLDTGFNPGNGGSIHDIYTSAVQTDGKIIIGGWFTSVGGTARNRIARLNTDGSIDLSFNPGSGAAGDVKTIAVQADGKILIGGEFTAFNGTVRNRIARLNTDGTLDTSFNPGSGANNFISAIAVQPDGKIIIGGWFTAFNGVIRNRIARLNSDGSLDQSFNPVSGANSGVDTIVMQADGKIIIGGYFTAFNGTTRNRIARLNNDGSLDASFNPSSGANGVVYTISVQAYGKVIIGGSFTEYKGIVRNGIARIHSGNSDGDFVEDAADKFPFDSTEWFDNDNDGIGNNADTDDDNDGMADAWEIQYGLNPLVNDGSADADSDGISNLQEYTNGSNPATAVTVKNDYNNDGIAGWIWKGVSNGNETASQNWQLTFPLYSNNWATPNRFYHPVFADQANWEMVTSGDFNKDGDADILWRNNATAQWKVWQMQSGLRSTQNNLADFDLAHEWTVVGAGDTDKDGDDDVILTNVATGEVMIWTMQDHALASTHNIGSKPGYILNRIGDFNKDGDVDLLFRQVGSDALITWEIEANAFVQERALANTGAGYNPVCSADFDEDGDDDILLINNTTQQEKWLVMENYTRTQQFGGTNTGFSFLGCGDYDGDGDADSLWKRDSDDMTRVVLQQNWGATKQTIYTNAFGGANGFIYRGNSN